MCLTCGCGEPDTRHQPTDITREDLERAAQGGGLTVDQAAANLSDALSKLDAGPSKDTTAKSR